MDVREERLPGTEPGPGPALLRWQEGAQCRQHSIRGPFLAEETDLRADPLALPYLCAELVSNP